MTETALAGRRALVTGGAGFIGSHLVEALRQAGADVVVLDNFAAGQPSNLDASPGIELLAIDLNSPDTAAALARGRFDLLFHLAGHANVRGSVEHPRLDFEQNMLATFNLLEAVRAHAPRTKIVFASSATVYGETAGELLTEDAPCRPIAPYAISKLAGEHQMRAYAALYGLNTTVVRMLSAFGPRQRKQVVFDIMRKVQANPSRLPLFGDGSEVRDLTYVTDAVAAMLLVAAHAPGQGEVYNVAAGRSVTIRELARLICERMGADPELDWSGGRRAGETQGWMPALDRIRALGFRPRVSIEDGLDRTVEWFMREGRCQ